MKARRVAIIGLGHVAHHHVQAILSTPSLTLVAGCDVDARRRTAIPPDVIFFADYREMLLAENIDIVIVAVPTRSHASVVQEVIESGHDLIVEKPLATDVATIDTLLESAERHGCRLIPALHAAFGREVLWLESTMNTAELDDLGPITGFYCGFFDPYVEDNSLAEGAKGLEGSWTDSAINALSVIGRFVDPSRLSLTEVTKTYLHGYDGEVQANGLFRLSGASIGGMGVIQTNWMLGVNKKTTRLFFGERNAEVLMDHSSQCVHLYRHGKEQQLAELFDGTDRLTAHYQNLFSMLSESSPDRSFDLGYARTLHSLCTMT